jgi:hypothetical protein
MGHPRKKCPVVQRNGRTCSNKGKVEYNGYCGIHKEIYILSKTEESDGRTARILKFIPIAASLATLIEKAATYLPDVIQIFLDASRVAFVRQVDFPQTDFPIGRKRGALLASSEEKEQLVPFKLAPRTMSDSLNYAIKKQDWDLLSRRLIIDFEVQIQSGKVPAALMKQIMEKRSEVLDELTALGYKFYYP